MTDPRTSPPERVTGPTTSGAGRALRVLAPASALAALMGIGLAGWLWYDTYTYVPGPREDVSLLGLGYVVAAVVAVPAGLALALAGYGWWLGRRGREGLGVGLTAVALAMMVPFAILALRPLL